MGGFESDLRDRTAPVAQDFSADSRTLLIVFGGGAGGVNIPPFEFFRVTAAFPVNKVFLRDLDYVYYQRGLRGVAAGMDGVTAYLRRTIAAQKSERTVFVGNSMGAHAAIFFGWALEATRVVVFACRSFVNPLKRALGGDMRTLPLQLRAYWNRSVPSRCLDLRNVLAADARRTEIHLHFDANHRLDRMHARRLQEFPNVVLHEHRAGGHALVRHLRDRGELEVILRAALEGNVSNTPR